MADDPVVVLKFRPMKAGNSVEEKTGMTSPSVDRGRCVSKAVSVAKGRSLFKESQNCV